MNRFLFYLSARLFGEACLELYICRITPDGREQVYLIPRPKNDPFYPSMLHMPGVRKIPNERDTDHLIRAIEEVEFRLPVMNYEYVLSTTVKTKRGTVFTDIRRIQIPYDEGQSGFYDANDLPDNLIEHHYGLINELKKGANVSWTWTINLS